MGGADAVAQPASCRRPPVAPGDLGVKPLVPGIELLDEASLLVVWSHSALRFVDALVDSQRAVRPGLLVQSPNRWTQVLLEEDVVHRGKPRAEELLVVANFFVIRVMVAEIILVKEVVGTFVANCLVQIEPQEVDARNEVTDGVAQTHEGVKRAPRLTDALPRRGQGLEELVHPHVAVVVIDNRLTTAVDRL